VELIVTPAALKQLRSLPKDDAKRLIAAMQEVAANHPQRMSFVAEMVGQPGRWRARKGDYRAIYEITDNEIVVLAIGSRKDINR
jgi:mRNA-degrading endonuclease RelE of RelBE toxin-antitoxin system